MKIHLVRFVLFLAEGWMDGWTDLAILIVTFCSCSENTHKNMTVGQMNPHVFCLCIVYCDTDCRKWTVIFL
jgi:hypothetical protein